MMNVPRFFDATQAALANRRVRAALLVLVFSLLPFIGHYAWFFGEFAGNNIGAAITSGERVPLVLPVPDHWLLPIASMSMAGFAGLVWVLVEVLNWVQE